MFSAFPLICFGLAAMAAAGGAGYGLAAGADQGGSALLFVASAALGALGTVLVVLGQRDAVAVVAADAPPELRPVATSDRARGSIWPFGAALAAALLAVGTAVGAPMVGVGVIAVALAALGWVAQAWREHPAWNPRLADRLNDRIVTPLGLPVAIFALAAIGVLSFSRLLLAVSAEGSALLAIAAAIMILAVFSLLAARPHIGKNGLALLAAFAVVAVIASGIAGAVAGEREFHHADSGEAEHQEGTSEEETPAAEEGHE